MTMGGHSADTIFNVHVQGLTNSSGFFGVVQYYDALDAGGQGFEQQLHREGAESMYLHHAKVLSQKQIKSA